MDGVALDFFGGWILLGKGGDLLLDGIGEALCRIL